MESKTPKIIKEPFFRCQQHGLDRASAVRNTCSSSCRLGSDSQLPQSSSQMPVTPVQGI